jgi:SAM-dependent methyltransferase
MSTPLGWNELAELGGHRSWNAEGPRHGQRLRWEGTASGRLGDLWSAPTTQYYRRREEALLAAAWGPLGGKRVLKLDLWNEAFNTRILHWMAGQGAEVFAFDLSQTVTAQARRNGGCHAGCQRVACADIREFPFRDQSFDCLYTMGTIEHICEYRQSLREIRRVLRPGGKAVVGVPYRWDPFLRPLLVTVLELLDRYPYAPEKSFSAGELRRDLEGAGLRVLQRTGILALPGILRLADLYFHRRGSRLDALTAALSVPFERCERRFQLARNLGYLMAMVVERPLQDPTG